MLTHFDKCQISTQKNICGSKERSRMNICLCLKIAISNIVEKHLISRHTQYNELNIGESHILNKLAPEVHNIHCFEFKPKYQGEKY